MKKYLVMFSKGCRAIKMIDSRRRLSNKNFTIISSNCIGGVLYKELGCKFLSPTINLYILPEDFLKFVKNLEYYLQQELKFIESTNYNFPVAQLLDIKIYFMHYKSEKEAKEKWVERSKRINYKNIFIIMTDKDGCTEKQIKDFDNLPYENKVIFTNRKANQYSSEYYIKGFEHLNSVGDIINYSNLLGIRYYDQFNFINWLNSNKSKEGKE